MPKAKKNWEEEKKLFSLVLRLLGFYILLFQGQSLLISSETFPVPSQLRRGMGNTPVLTEKRGWEGRKHGKVTGGKEREGEGGSGRRNLCRRVINTSQQYLQIPPLKNTRFQSQA